MEPNKFEEYIRKQLQEREIQPSGDAWNKINDSLGPSSEATKRNYWWYGIAASFVGALFVSILYFSSNKMANRMGEEIVTTPKVITEDKVFEGKQDLKIELERPLVGNEPSPKKRREAPVPKAGNSVKKVHALTHQNESLPLPDEKVAVELPEKLIDVKIAEVLEHVSVLENNDTNVTDAEIDSLLRRAQREILEDKIFRKDDTVDAMALLADVEKELDKSFRDEIFDALKDGFLKVRTAVADRNR